MTMTQDIGKFKTELKNTEFLGTFKREVELEIIWISCGYYSITGEYVKTPTEEEFPNMQPKLDFNLHLTPEWIEKVFELFPNAVKRNRPETYIPFYQDYSTDRGMFDFGHDMFFQAFKDNLFDDRVILTNYYFNYGVPSSKVDVLNLQFSEFKRLKEFLDNPNGYGPEIFYSGCQVAQPSLKNSNQE